VYIAFALALAACSSSSAHGGAGAAADNPSGGSAVGGSTGSAAVQEAKAQVAKYEAAQAPISIPPLTKPIPKNVALAILTCANQPSCQAETDGAATAAQKLGWSVKQYQSALTPQGYQAAWTSLMQGNPTAIIYSAIFPDANIASILAEVKSRGIPTVSISPYTKDAAGSPTAIGPARVSVVGPTLYEADGKLMGDVIVADAGGPAQVLFVWDPNFSGIHGPVKTGLDTVVQGAGGSVSTLNISAANVGQSVPSQVVSYLQSHPSIKYLAFVVSDFEAGVVPALHAAGLADKVKIVSRAPEAANLVALKNGSELAQVADENIAGGWRCTDAMIRLLSGTPTENDVSGWHQIFVKDNVTETSQQPVTPGVPDSFVTAWKISS
jgi:hypothetical protein